MKISTEMSLIPVSHEIKPVTGVSSRSVGTYTPDRESKLVRISFMRTKQSRVGSTYGRIGNEKETKGTGENIDIYV